MLKKLTRTGNSLALVLDKALLEATRIDASTPLALSTDGDVIVISPVRGKKRKARIQAVVADAHERYGEVFRKLAR